MLGDMTFGSFLLVGGIIAVAAALAVVAYELHRHWDAAKRILSRWADSVHRALARLPKWLTESLGSALFAGDGLVVIKPGLRARPRLSPARDPIARGLDSGGTVGRATSIAQPAPMLQAVGRAAAAAAFAAPLMLAGAPAFAAPFASTNDTARIAAPLSALRMAHNPIVINYAPNVVIHSEDASDAAALKHRVMEVLERHGRELHQTLQREIVRQQRRDF